MTTTGSCACGTVRYSIAEKPTEGGMCHCGMCRRWCGGGPEFAIQAKSADISESDDSLSWWKSSSWGERGFCSVCGTSMFWRLQNKGEGWAVAIGTLDDDSKIGMKQHIFIDDKPSYYDVESDGERLTGREFTDRVFSDMKLPMRIVAKTMYFLSNLKPDKPPPEPPKDGPWTGRCSCGAVGVSTKTRPSELVICHCATCRRAHGGAAGLWVPLDDVAFTGEDNHKWWQDEKGAQRSHCAKCGTTIAWRKGSDGKVRVAASVFEPEPELSAVTVEHGDNAHGSFRFATAQPAQASD